MRVGDLVCWHTEAHVFSGYADTIANPGIVLDIFERSIGPRAYVVRWNDGKLTTEHECYIMLAEEHKEKYEKLLSRRRNKDRGSGVGVSSQSTGGNERG